MIDITQYGENELSMMVFNDEYLYKIRNSEFLVGELKEFFLFTDEQLEVLKTDIAEDE